MTNPNDEWPKAGSHVERLTLFSDAIFAFAMTLAVNIRVPEITQDLVGSQLSVEIVNLASKLLGYGLSFFISAVSGSFITAFSSMSSATTEHWYG